MSYNELVKNLDHVRSYMREFYVYGFKSREEYDKKSLRSYDDEKRRIESWLGDYMGFRRTTDGKNAFLSIDSREVRHNPFYKAWKAKSFTNGDITLHFILFDILNDAAEPLSLSEITEKIDSEYLNLFDNPMLVDESTVRKKLKEYAQEGLVTLGKDGKKTVFSVCRDTVKEPSRELLDFFSEVAPCGVIGSFLLDKSEPGSECFAFKHNYITSALDSDVLCCLFDVMQKKAYAEISTVARMRATPVKFKIVPLQVFISVQSGRQHLMAWNTQEKRIKSYRLDYIQSVAELETCPEFDEYREMLNKKKQFMWGVMCRKDNTSLDHIEFTVHAEDNEGHIYRRLLREKRIGTIEMLDANTYRFSADVFDLNEMIPWIRTFICRITDIRMSNRGVEARFKKDLRLMYQMYGIGGGDDAVQ